MDRRQQLKNNKNQQTVNLHDEQLNDEALNDSLIFNIIKKIQFRQKMQYQYATAKQSSNNTFLTKYVFHSWNPTYYLAAIMAVKAYKIFTTQNFNKKVFGIGNTLLHLCVALTINEYDKYHQTFKINNSLGDQYRQHKANVDRLILIKTQRISLYQKFVNSQFFNPDRVFNALKYRVIL